MKIEDLVPPLDFCKRIPEGEFKDTYAAYFFDANGANITLDKREGDSIWKDVVIAPAPTLQEIMSTMPHCRVYKKTNGRFIAVHDKIRITNMDGATAALKLWFKNKGIEE